MRPYKIVLLGDSGVGKTSIATRIKYNKFSSIVESTIGCEFFAKKYNTDTKLLFWDTAGQEVFRTFTPQFSRGASVGIIFHDLTKPFNIKNIQLYINMLPLDSIIIISFTKDDLYEGELPFVCLENFGHIYVNKNPISSLLNKNIDKLEEMILEKINLIRDTNQISKDCINIETEEIGKCCKFM